MKRVCVRIVRGVTAPLHIWFKAIISPIDAVQHYKDMVINVRWGTYLFMNGVIILPFGICD